MNEHPKVRRFAALFAAVLSFAVFSPGLLRPDKPAAGDAAVTPMRLDQSRPGRYARSFQALDGSIHLMGLFKIVENGSRVAVRDESDPAWGVTALNESRINTFYSRPGFFLGIGNRVRPGDSGGHTARVWRSFDDLRTIREEETRIIIPEAGQVDYGTPDQWSGLFFHRGVVELSDGSLLAAMYGNFEQDLTPPSHPWSKTETKYKLRAFAVRSTDRGETWRYLSSLAVPDTSAADESEGFNEWTLTRLEDGRLLAVIRTGHFTPMVACWSSDEGRSWTPPRILRELGPAGCDPWLIRLNDGRVALAYGEMVQPPPSGQEEYWRDFETRGDRRRRCRMALSADGGESWSTLEVADYANRSAYATIFEVAPNVILYQADLELWRVEIPPR